MNVQIKYNRIANSTVLAKFYSIYKPTSKHSITYKEILLNIIVMSLCVYDSLYSHLLFLEFNVVVFLIVQLILMLIVFLPAYHMHYSKNMKLIITENGILLFPNKFIAGIPLFRFVAEEWKDLEFYSIYELNSLLKIGSIEEMKYCLYIRTNGNVPRCVNTYGMSVFAITGHHLNKNDVNTIKMILDKHGIVYKSK